MKKFIALLLAFLLVISLTGCKGSDYKQAMELYANDDYAEALAIFTELGDYKDSSSMVSKCKYAMAQQLMLDGDYEGALVIFEELGDYKDSAESLKECYYQRALRLVAEQQYDAAEEIFAMLGNYKDSANYANGIGLYVFMNYISEHGRLTPADLLYRHTGTITVKDGCLRVEIANGLFTVKLVIYPGRTTADLYAEELLELGLSKVHDTAYEKWDISQYQKGDIISWDEYDAYCSGRDYWGNYNGSTSLESLRGGTGANQITALIDCLYKGLESCGLGITMADLGFASYSP